MKRFYIPHNLNIDILVSKRPPLFKPFKIDKLIYILSLIHIIPTYNRDMLSNEFTFLNSTTLQEVVQNYKQYLNYLENDLEIIESDNQYIVGQKSKGFRFVEQYRTEVKFRSIQDYTLKKKLRIIENKKITSCSHLKYLTKWFNPGLEFDFDSALKFLDEELRIKSNYPDLIEMDKNNRQINPINQYNCSIINSDKLFKREFNLVQDSNVKRFHTNLTNLRSILRNALTYKGENLISIDLKNSQPYLSIGLLNNNILINIINNKYNYYYIMLGEILRTLDFKGGEGYIELASSGNFYEYLTLKFAEKGFNYSNRKLVKQAVFQVLFTDNRFIGQKEAKPKRIFKELFPEVYNVFAKIKRNDKTLLPRVLQYVESTLFIDRISLRISREFPNTPIFTIHDSIATTREYVDDFKKIVSEELERAIGYAPTLHLEEWKKENLEIYLKSLKGKIRQSA